MHSLAQMGHQAVRLVRAASSGGEEVGWAPYEQKIDPSLLEGADAIVHLSGESIAGRWTAAKKARIRTSRMQLTGFLSKTVARLNKPPEALICASAIGYYGSRGEEILTEESRPGTDFLAQVTEAWELATTPASEKGIRVVNLRTGVVLGSNGGSLAKMLQPFKFGLGGILGDGQQYMSWISLTDVVAAIQHAIEKKTVTGPVNLVAPNPVTNLEFTKALGRVLRRPTIVPLPGFMIKMLFGEMGQALLLGSTRVTPAKLLETGYEFKHTELEDALRAELAR